MWEFAVITWRDDFASLAIAMTDLWGIISVSRVATMDSKNEAA